MSPVDDYIRELLAASPQGHVDESFEALNDPRVRQAGELAGQVWMPDFGDDEAGGANVSGMPTFVQRPGMMNDLQSVISEAMHQPPIPIEEMNARPYPTVTGTIEDDDPDYGPPPLDPENSPQDYIAQNFPRQDERLATPGWIPGDEPEVLEGDVSRYEDKRNSSTSRTMGVSPGATAPFRLRGPVNLQLDEQQSLISRLLNAFR